SPGRNFGNSTRQMKIDGPLVLRSGRTILLSNDFTHPVGFYDEVERRVNLSQAPQPAAPSAAAPPTPSSQALPSSQEILTLLSGKTSRADQAIPSGQTILPGGARSVLS